MKFYHFNLSLFKIDMTPQQRKVATYLQEFLKFNDKKELPSNSLIAKETKVSVNSIGKIIKDLKLMLLKQVDETWLMMMPNKKEELMPVEDWMFKNGDFDYVMIKEEVFKELDSRLLETYIRVKKLSIYTNIHRTYTPTWSQLAEKWDVNYNTLRTNIYKLSKYINYNLRENKYITNLEVI